jgi:hypothetical protein
MYLTGSKALDYHLGQRFDLNKDWDIIAIMELTGTIMMKLSQLRKL